MIKCLALLTVPLVPRAVPADYKAFMPVYGPGTLDGFVIGSECAKWYRTNGTFTDFLMRCFDCLDRAPFTDRSWPAAGARYEPFDSQVPK